jgi:3D (Asp-Asp-Asp) domain-containing protein
MSICLERERIEVFPIITLNELFNLIHPSRYKFVLLLVFTLYIQMFTMMHSMTESTMTHISNQPNLPSIPQLIDQLDGERDREYEKTRVVTITAYTNSPGETMGDPNMTASGQKVRLGIIAVSRDLLRDGWSYGSTVYIEGIGEFTIADTMSSRYKNRADIFMFSKRKAITFGVERNVKMGLIKKRSD